MKFPVSVFRVHPIYKKMKFAVFVNRAHPIYKKRKFAAMFRAHPIYKKIKFPVSVFRVHPIYKKMKFAVFVNRAHPIYKKMKFAVFVNRAHPIYKKIKLAIFVIRVHPFSRWIFAVFLMAFEFFHLRDFDKYLKWCKFLHETAIFHLRSKRERSGFSLLNLTALLYNLPIFLGKGIRRNLISTVI